MDQLQDFINMEGYGGYVWPSYLVTAGLMIILLVTTQRFLRVNMATLETLENTTKEDLE
jgi:heme exporter protein CcmD